MGNCFETDQEEIKRKIKDFQQRKQIQRRNKMNQLEQKKNKHLKVYYNTVIPNSGVLAPTAHGVNLPPRIPVLHPLNYNSFPKLPTLPTSPKQEPVLKEKNPENESKIKRTNSLTKVTETKVTDEQEIHQDSIILG